MSYHLLRPPIESYENNGWPLTVEAKERLCEYSRDLEQQLADATDSANLLDKEVSDVRGELVAMIQERDSLREQIEQTKQVYQCSIDAWEQIIKDLREKLDGCRSALKATNDVLDAEIATLREQLRAAEDAHRQEVGRWSDKLLASIKREREVEAALAEANRQRDCLQVEKDAYFGAIDKAKTAFDAQLAEIVPSDIRQAADDIADDGHCRYCPGRNNDSRLKCDQDIDSTRDDIVLLIKQATEKLKSELEAAQSHGAFAEGLEAAASLADSCIPRSMCEYDCYGTIAKAIRAIQPAATKPQCVGYPGGCDGDLPGEPHEPECPCYEPPAAKERE